MVNKSVTSLQELEWQVVEHQPLIGGAGPSGVPADYSLPDLKCPFDLQTTTRWKLLLYPLQSKEHALSDDYMVGLVNQLPVTAHHNVTQSVQVYVVYIVTV